MSAENWGREITDYRDVVFFDKLWFQNVFFLLAKTQSRHFQISPGLKLTNRIWVTVVCILFDNDTRHHSGQNVVDWICMYAVLFRVTLAQSSR